MHKGIHDTQLKNNESWEDKANNTKVNRVSHAAASCRNVSMGGPHTPFLRLIKKSNHGWLSMMTSSVPPFSTLPGALPTLSPQLLIIL